ncbi:MAG: hypothetical protein E6G94_02375 [Alphaproteobacteria bacterium]|nr:MAG: hypothetical protein E6G94_02375 [Alphaproteobacteria bacterium]
MFLDGRAILFGQAADDGRDAAALTGAGKGEGTFDGGGSRHRRWHSAWLSGCNRGFFNVSGANGPASSTSEVRQMTDSASNLLAILLGLGVFAIIVAVGWRSVQNRRIVRLQAADGRETIIVAREDDEITSVATETAAAPRIES